MEFGQERDPKRRLIAISAVILIHIIMIWGLASGLVRKAMDVIPPPIKTKVLEEAAVEDEPPPPPPPKFEAPPPAFVPPPEISIATASTGTNAITASAKPTPPKPATADKPPVVKAKNCREPDYPAVSERLGETGTVLLQLLVGVDGKVSESKIEKSSGFPRLDKAAQDALSRCRFTPGTVGGQPAPAWAQLKYTFRRDR